VEDLAVMSVIADPSAGRRLVVEAAYELAGLCREDRLPSARRSLFDLPVGNGHSWEIEERRVRT